MWFNNSIISRVNWLRRINQEGYSSGLFHQNLDKQNFRDMEEKDERTHAHSFGWLISSKGREQYIDILYI